MRLTVGQDCSSASLRISPHSHRSVPVTWTETAHEPPVVSDMETRLRLPAPGVHRPPVPLSDRANERTGRPSGQVSDMFRLLRWAGPQPYGLTWSGELTSRSAGEGSRCMQRAVPGGPLRVVGALPKTPARWAAFRIVACVASGPMPRFRIGGYPARDRGARTQSP
jgi:hypothetical protein